jgi:hypothetical protein
MEVSSCINLKPKEYSYKDIDDLKTKINNIDSNYHVYILKILRDNNIEFSENKNGCFVNLLNVPNSTISKIEQYITFIEDEEKHLKEFEDFKEKYSSN